MDRSKVAVLVLVLVAIVFVATLGVGASKSDDSPTTIESADALPDWTKAIGTVLVPLSPKIELTDNIFRIEANRRFVGPTGQTSIPVPSSDDRLRTGTFQLTDGDAAELIYSDRTADAPENLQSQVLELARASGKEKDSIIVLKSGGALTIQCLSTTDCTVLLID